MDAVVAMADDIARQQRQSPQKQGRRLTAAQITERLIHTVNLSFLRRLQRAFAAGDELPAALETLKSHAPYGQGVEKPVFALRNYCLVSKGTQTHRQMGKQQEHIKLFGRFADAVGFQLAEAYQSLGCPSTVDLLGSIGENTFRGVTSLQFQFHAIQASQEPLLP